MRVEDILEAISKVEKYLGGMTWEEFVEDQQTREAVTWNLAVICEASRAIPVDVQQLVPQIPWAKMRAMRNVLMHEYFGIDETDNLGDRQARSPRVKGELTKPAQLTCWS